jgi:hypothetical protein
MNERISLDTFPPKPDVLCVEPPVAHHIHLLPLDKLSWESLERLCVRLAKTNPDAEHAQAYGIRGQSQEGIDLYLRQRSNGRYEVWQCKRYQTFDKSNLRAAASAFLKAFSSKRAGIPIQDAETLILAVTADMSDVHVAKELERLAKRFRKLGLRLVARDINGLSDELKKHRELVEDFFTPAMADAFCGSKRSSIVEDIGQLTLIQKVWPAVQEGLSSSGNTILDQIRDLWGERHEDDALVELEKFKCAPTWILLNADIRAKALRIEAGLRLQKKDVIGARKCLDESKRISPTANARVLEGRFIEHDQDADAALAFLGEPKTDDERVFRWNLLLGLGRPKEVTDEFAALEGQEIPAGDFSSVLALAQLAQFDVSAADRTIQAALQTKPKHVTSRYVAAVVDYYSGVSPAFRAWRHMTWPVPPAWNLVKRDPVSVERRRKAAQTFEELATTVLKTDAGELRVWQLACVALNSSDAREPSEFARSCLVENPANLPVLVWASALGLEFDRVNSIAALRKRLEGSGGSLEDLLALLGLLDDLSDFASYGSLLAQHRLLFVNAGREHLWYLHQAQFLIEQDNIAEAQQLANSMPQGDERQHIKMAIRHLIVDRTGRKEDYQLLLQAQEGEYQTSKTAENLLACCRTHRLLQQWDFVAHHAQELVRSVGTQSALEIAVEGLLQARRANECLDLLRENRALCQNGELTPFLRQLAAEAHRLLGDLPGAIQELEQAAAKEEGIAAKMQLFQTHLHKGDLPAALQTARLLSLNPHVPVEFLVGQVIPIARHHDPELAKELILKVESTAAPLSPQIEAKLMEEASRTGVESTFQKLVGKLTQQAVTGKGPLQAFTYEQTRQMFLDRRKQAEELWAAYVRGEIPAHLLSARLNVPLAKLLHEASRRGIKNRQPLQTQPVFTRFASDANSKPCVLPADANELFLDISSFLLLDALDLLPSVESAFERVHIGSSLVQCLEEHLDQLSPQQPPRVFARKEVIADLDASKFAIWQPGTTPLPPDSSLAPFVSEMGIEWCQRLSQIHEDSGLFVDFLPLHSRADINRQVLLPSPIKAVVFSAEQLIRAMKQAGWITGKAPSKAVSPSEQPDTSIPLREGMPVHLDGGQAEELALAGVFQTLCEKASVTIDAGEAAQLRQEVAKERADEELKHEIQRLLAHVSSAIGKAKYKVHVANPFEYEVGDSPLEPIVRALHEAVDFGGKTTIPICIDDRLVRQHTSAGKAPLCDTCDVLHHLQSRSAISVETFQCARSRMRAANLRYLPVSTEEILSAVGSAPIQNEELQETPELTSLRRYVSATLLDHHTLQGPLSNQEGKVNPREGIWPHRVQAAITKALVDVWLNDSLADNQLQLQADWLWFNLCFDERLPAELFGHKLPDYDPADLVSRKVASLYSLGFGLYDSATGFASVKARRKRYFQWLTERVVTPLLPNNPNLWLPVGKHMRSVFSSLGVDVQKLRSTKGKEPIDKLVIRRLIASYIADLPTELVDGLRLDPAELEILGLTSNSPGIETMGLSFPAKEFWEAIARALKKNHAALWTPDHKTKLGIRYTSTNEQISISAKGATDSGWHVLNVPLLGLLSTDQKQREAALRSEAAAFDLDEPQLSEVIQEISATASAFGRVTKRTTYRDQSVAALYADIGQSIRDRKTVCIHDLLPAQTDCLRRHLRLDFDDKALDAFAERLIQGVGWGEAVVRLSRIPASLPDAIISEWRLLTGDEQSSRLKELESELVTPIERIHFLELLCHSATTATGRLDQAKEQLSWLTKENLGVAHGRAMLTVVRWVHLRLGWHEEASKWSAFTRLCVAWSHGCGLHRAFQTANATPEGIEKWFANNSQEFFADRFILTNPITHDAANPVQLRICTLVLKGVASACGNLDDNQIRDLSLQQTLSGIIGAKAFADQFDVWIDRTLGGNLLGSYLADLPDSKLKRAIGDAACDQYFPFQPRQIAEHYLGTLEQTPDNVESLLLLNSVVGDRPFYEDLRGKIPGVLAELNFVQFFKNSPETCGQYVSFTTQLAVSAGDQSLANKVWEQCLHLAAHLATDNPTTGKVRLLHQHLAFSLTEAATRLSGSPSGRKMGLQMLVNRLTELARRWHGFAGHYGLSLAQAINRVPVNEATGLQELRSLLRSCT